MNKSREPNLPFGTAFRILMIREIPVLIVAAFLIFVLGLHSALVFWLLALAATLVAGGNLTRRRAS